MTLIPQITNPALRRTMRLSGNVILWTLSVPLLILAAIVALTFVYFQGITSGSHAGDGLALISIVGIVTIAKFTPIFGTAAITGLVLRLLGTTGAEPTPMNVLLRYAAILALTYVSSHLVLRNFYLLRFLPDTVSMFAMEYASALTLIAMLAVAAFAIRDLWSRK
jgi:hypothetical protein